MAHVALILLALVAGCGRISFEARGDGGGSSDGRTGDASTNLVDAPVSNGLVAWYRLDEDIGATNVALDSSGNGYHAMPDSVFPEQATDRFGALGAAQFDGASTVLVVPTTGGMFDLPAFTITAWFYPESANPNPFEILLSRTVGTAQANSFALDVASGSLLEYFSQPSASLYGLSVYLFFQWQHVAISFDGTTKRLYYMGSLESSGPAAAPLTYDAHPITIGVDISSETYAYHFHGRLDDVMIFDRALSDPEIQELAAFP